MVTMIMNRAVLSLVIGLLALVRADILKSNNVLDALGNDFLYKEFACRNKANGLRLPVAGSCVEYYECKNGRAERLRCKAGYNFNNYGLTCLDARMSKCKPDQLAITVSCSGQCCGHKNGIYPMEGSCSDFVACINGQPFQKSCGGHLKFSAESLICDVPERARCSTAIEKDIINENSPNKPTMYLVSRRVCIGKSNGYNVEVRGSCNKFYLCMNEVGYLKSCGNMQFNPEKQYCDSINRMFCSEFEDDDVILEEEEYPPISILPMPMPHPRPKPLPLPSEEDEEEIVYRPVKRPSKGKKGDKSQKKPPPYAPEDDQAEEVVHIWTPWGKRPVQTEPETIPEEVIERPYNGELESNTDELPQSPPRRNKRPHKADRRPAPPVLEIPESSEIEEEPPLPKRRPGYKNKKPSLPEPPQIDSTEDEEEDQKESSSNTNLCADQPVGALLPIPTECTKYIRCRWDYFERRVAEVITCPSEMHFNAKTKYCDLPAKAGCQARLDAKRQSSKF